MLETGNRQDPYPSTLQEALVSIQVQDTAPPILATAQSQGHPHEFVLQPKSTQRHNKSINLIPMSIAIILIILAAIVRVLSITNSEEGPWSSIWTAIFTAVGMILIVLQLSIQFNAEPFGANT